jgi:GR25 family glycosyltransferase involved in LPS biosynthesis
MPGTLITEPEATFERVYCVNLDRRPDRWKRFADGLPSDWPWPAPIRVSAIDGHRVKHPPYWRPGGGAWGCFRSHLRLIEQCLNEGVRSVLLLEDDALFTDGFTARALDWLRHVPANWHMLYLGGQHLRTAARPPVRVGDQLYQPFNVNRTHAFAIQGDGLRIVYHHLLRRDWSPRHHIDHHLGRLVEQRVHRIYCPPEWLVGQAGGKSNISGRQPPDRFWKAASSLTHHSPDVQSRVAPSQPFLAIIGLHSSGSSALAAALWNLGVWFGEPDQLTGYWGAKSPAKGGEHRELAAILEKALPFGAVKRVKPRRWLWHRLRKFISDLQSAALHRGTIAAAKYPQLCQTGRQLQNLCGERLRVIVCDRPIEESIASIHRRTCADDATRDKLTAHQRWLAAGRDAIADAIPGQTRRVSYSALLADPAGQLHALSDWLGLQPTNDQYAAAECSILPKLRHVG